MIDELDLAICDIKTEVSLINIYHPIPAAAGAAATATAPLNPQLPVNAVPQQVTVNLIPPNEVKRRLFRGNPADYKGFIAEHDAEVGTQRIANVLKLQKLKERCDGEAFDAIKRFNTDAGYQEALDKLKQRFGSDEKAVLSLHHKLRIPIKNKNDITEVRKSFDDFECCLMKLKEYGRDIEDVEYKNDLVNKLPDKLKEHLATYQSTLGREATLTEVRQQIDLQISGLNNFFQNTLQLQQPRSDTAARFERPKAVANATQATHNSNDKRHDSKQQSQQGQHGQQGQRDHQSSQGQKKKPKPARPRRPPKCTFCEGPHWSDDCSIITTLDEARVLASEKNLCFTCFRHNHPTAECPKNVSCHICKGQHHTLRHRNFGDREPKKDTKKNSPVVAAYKTTDINSDSEVLLFTREVLVSNPANPSLKQKVLIFVDNGAQIPLIDRKLSYALRLPFSDVSANCQGADSNSFVASGKYKLNIHLQDGTTVLVYPFGAANLVQKIAVPKVPVEKYLAATKGKGPLPVVLGHPLLLLSMKEYAMFFAGEKSNKLPNGFILWQSKLGPFISGEGKIHQGHARPDRTVVSNLILDKEDTAANTPQDEPMKQDEVNQVDSKQAITKVKATVQLDNTEFYQQVQKIYSPRPTHLIQVSVDHKIDSTPKVEQKKNLVVAKVWVKEMLSDPKFLYDLELLGITDDPNADETRLFKQRFLESVRQDKDGRIFAELPFHDLTGLGTNLNNCYKRLASQSKKFERDPEYAAAYKHCVDEFFTNDFTEIIPTEVIDEADGHFLPHSIVLTPAKTTPARFVIDGSCTTEKGSSINEKLLTGENRLPQLSSILLRARAYPIIVASDIRKAFLQIHLLDDSKKFVRFLFLKDIAKPISRDNLIVYQFKVVPFGLNPSPNMLSHAIEFHLNNYAESHPELKKYLDQISKNNYVDNLVMGAHDPQEAISSNDMIKEAFSAGQMDLRGHFSNNAEVNSHYNFTEKSANFLGHEMIIESDELVIG
uniref:Reverse transcriptase domain-containing protein n=1 Tax=Panagrolaimus davidi TaxID=227884 RepID=A0A914PDL8_9BILA